MDLLEQHHQRTQALPLERQGLVQAPVALQPLVHNVLLNPHILLVVESHLAREAKAAKERKEASPPRAKRKEVNPPGAMENAD